MYRMRAIAWPRITTRKKETFFVASCCQRPGGVFCRAAEAAVEVSKQSVSPVTAGGQPRRLPLRPRRGPAPAPPPASPPALPSPADVSHQSRQQTSLQTPARRGPQRAAPTSVPLAGAAAASAPARSRGGAAPSKLQGTVQGAALPRDQVYSLCPFRSVFSSVLISRHTTEGGGGES